MPDKNDALKEIARIIEMYASSADSEFVEGKSKIKLMEPAFGTEEIVEAIDSFLSGYVSMGEKVRKFEEMFSQYLGVNYSTMVNSGSAANLLALSILSEDVIKNSLKPGEEIITPAITWATTVYPISDVGAVPVFVDVEPGTYNIDVSKIEENLTEKTKVIMPVHLLGNPCDIKEIVDLAKERNLFVVEDTCEAHGAEYDGKKVGGFGDIGTFSFYIAHHITTIEGGMVVTNDEKISELAKSKRVFGWIRDLKDKNIIKERYKGLDERFLFLKRGFNMRPTEIQGAFGIHQIKKLDDFIKIRQDNAAFWSNGLKRYSDVIILPEVKKRASHVWYSYPITIRADAPFTRKECTDFLESRGIETRPIMAGNMAEQPVINHIKHRKAELPNSELIMRNGFFFGNHQAIKKREREYVLKTICEFMDSKT